MKEKIVKSEVTNLAENYTAHKRHIWEYQMGELMKTKKSAQGEFVQPVCFTDVTM